MKLGERMQGWHRVLRPDLSVSETAAILGVTPAAVRQWWADTHPPKLKHLTAYVERVLRMGMAEFYSAVPAPAPRQRQ